jgi:hypothetical protein
MNETIGDINLVNLVNTPLGASLEQVANDLADAEGPKIVVLVTDGEETCDGDPAKAIESLVKQDIDVHVNIVGFALNDDQLKRTFRQWARIGQGTYFDATDTEKLTESMVKAVQAPFRIIDSQGDVIASGTIDGGSVPVPVGTYDVEVLADPLQRFENVEVRSGEKTVLRLGQGER